MLISIASCINLFSCKTLKLIQMCSSFKCQVTSFRDSFPWNLPCCQDKHRNLNNQQSVIFSFLSSFINEFPVSWRRFWLRQRTAFTRCPTFFLFLPLQTSFTAFMLPQCPLQVEWLGMPTDGSRS